METLWARPCCAKPGWDSGWESSDIAVRPVQACAHPLPHPLSGSSCNASLRRRGSLTVRFGPGITPARGAFGQERSSADHLGCRDSGVPDDQGSLRPSRHLCAIGSSTMSNGIKAGVKAPSRQIAARSPAWQRMARPQAWRSRAARLAQGPPGHRRPWRSESSRSPTAAWATRRCCPACCRRSSRTSRSLGHCPLSRSCFAGPCRTADGAHDGRTGTPLR